MILRGRQFVTRSGRSKRQGRDDHYWLAPENEREQAMLEKLRSERVLITFSGPLEDPKILKELERVGRSIDPNLRRRIDRITPG